MPTRRVHDAQILDVLETLPAQPYSGIVWRTVWAGREPRRGTVSNGRWSSPGEFEVLYTSALREGSLAEIGYRLQLEPIWPSKLGHEIHGLEIELAKVLDLREFDLLERLGVETKAYESHRYSATQSIAAAVRFLEMDGILVPNARHPSDNLVIFVDKSACLDSIDITSSNNVDWSAWRDVNPHRPSRGGR